MHERLIIFTRCPEPRKCKTRLIPVLGADGAAELHQQMVRRTLRVAARFANDRPAQLEVEFDGEDAAEMERLFGSSFTYRRQSAGDLGARLSRSIRDAFDQNSGRVVVIGTDCPGVSSRILATAFRLLATHDVVLGPASDGGYYLIGLRAPQDDLFHDIPWGSGDVFQTTRQRAEESQLLTALLPTMDDVDRPEDLDVWQRYSGIDQPQGERVSLSVVVPTLGNESGLEATLKSIGVSDRVEAVVVAAGESAQVAETARSHGCIFAQSPPGRGRQMNLGAAVTSGDSILFLHADTVLPLGYENMVEELLAQPDVAAGAFPLALDAIGIRYRLTEHCINTRSRLLQLPYGDQALHFRRELFQALGGFRDWPIMEDFELVRRARREGKIRLADAAVQTSARRWQELGIWRTTWINQKIVFGYLLGVPVDRLATWYRPSAARIRESAETHVAEAAAFGGQAGSLHHGMAEVANTSKP
jgi:hypothetical protein